MDQDPGKADRRRRAVKAGHLVEVQSSAIAASIFRAFIFDQPMHALLLSLCRYFAKIADAKGAKSLSLVKCQVKKIFVIRLATPRRVRGSAILCYHDCCNRVSLTCAHSSSRVLIRPHVRSPFCQVTTPKQLWCDRASSEVKEILAVDGGFWAASQALADYDATQAEVDASRFMSAAANPSRVCFFESDMLIFFPLWTWIWNHMSFQRVSTRCISYPLLRGLQRQRLCQTLRLKTNTLETLPNDRPTDFWAKGLTIDRASLL